MPELAQMTLRSECSAVPEDSSGDEGRPGSKLIVRRQPAPKIKPWTAGFDFRLKNRGPFGSRTAGRVLPARPWYCCRRRRVTCSEASAQRVLLARLWWSAKRNFAMAGIVQPLGAKEQPLVAVCWLIVVVRWLLPGTPRDSHVIRIRASRNLSSRCWRGAACATS